MVVGLDVASAEKHSRDDRTGEDGGQAGKRLEEAERHARSFPPPGPAGRYADHTPRKNLSFRS